MSKQIVIIEDDRDILDLIQYILADEGYDVIGYDGVKSIEEIIVQQPALILLDNRLANGYGNTFCALLKSNSATKHIPVILVSASGNLNQIAESCHANAYLCKPFDLQDLIKMVKHYSEVSDSHFN